MNIDDFNFNLPENLIAQSPLKERRDSRLLIINPTKQTLQDSFFKQFTSHLSSNDLVIFNDTKVIKARLFGKKLTGGKVELLIERIFDNTNATALIKTSKTIKSGIEVMIDKGVYLKITDRKKEIFKTSGGKYIAPQVMENKFKESRIIEQIMVVGENEKMPAALIQVNFEFDGEFGLLLSLLFFLLYLFPAQHFLPPKVVQ